MSGLCSSGDSNLLSVYLARIATTLYALQHSHFIYMQGLKPVPSLV